MSLKNVNVSSCTVSPCTISYGTNSYGSRPVLCFALLFLALTVAASAAVFPTYVAAGERTCIDLTLASPGTLLVEALAAMSSPAEPRLDVYADEPGESLHWPLRQAAGGVVEVVAAGNYRVCVQAQDSERELGSVRITTGFAASALLKDGDPTEDEPDPDPLLSDPGCRAASFSKDGDPTEDEPDPDPLTSAPGSDAKICRQLARDDHSDVLTCASLLRPGASTRAELSDGWNEDYDVFFFILNELRTVRVATTGAATFGVLLDGQGQRLRADTGDEDLRLVKTLGPGLYYVRVTGGEGAYELSLTVLP
jgi:hypothetical protein